MLVVCEPEEVVYAQEKQKRSISNRNRSLLGLWAILVPGQEIIMPLDDNRRQGRPAPGIESLDYQNPPLVAGPWQILALHFDPKS